MELGLVDRVALISGASKGIGLATAKCLAAEGCDLHLVARTESDLDDAANAIRAKANVNVQVWPMDLSVSDNINRLFIDVGDFDILVNNAGAIPRGSIEDIDEATWREVWDLKVFGYINMCRHAFGAMKARGGGVIINVIGTGGERVNADYAVGAGGNASLMALTRALGSTSLPHGIRVVGINPGAIETPRLENLLRSMAQNKLDDEELWRDLLNPKYPPGQPEHIADMVAFLASDRSSNTTGTIITVDGGHTAR